MADGQTERNGILYETKRVGGTLVHTPIRTPEQEAARLEEIDRAVRRVLPGWRLKPPQEETPVAGANVG